MLKFEKNTVLITGGSLNLSKGNASTNLSIELARAYRQLGFAPFLVPQNPSCMRDEPAQGHFETIPYAYPMRRRNLFRGFGGWRDSLNFRFGMLINPLLTAWLIWRNRERISHVLSQTLPPTPLLILSVACRGARVPLIYNLVEEPWALRVHSDTGTWRRRLRVVQAAIPVLLQYSLVLRLPNLVTCITEELAQLLRRWRFNDKRVMFLPNVRFLDDIEHDEIRVAGTDDSPPVSALPFLLYSGQISNTKEAFVPLLEALRRVNANKTRLTLRIYGGGDATAVAKLKGLIRDFGMEGTVRYFGFVPKPELRAAMRRAMLCLLLKRHVSFNRYNFPTKLMDYLAGAKPVLMSDLPLHVRYFRNGVDALIVDPECVADIQNALEWALANPQALCGLGQRAKAKLREHFCAVKNVSRVLDRLGIGTVPGPRASLWTRSAPSVNCRL